MGSAASGPRLDPFHSGKGPKPSSLPHHPTSGDPSLLQSGEGIPAGPKVTSCLGRAWQQQAAQGLTQHR